MYKGVLVQMYRVLAQMYEGVNPDVRGVLVQT